ncbi:MAG TPA: helicase-related protein [Chloroflexia bacterium]|nr:helicase-related protein [Chloroflexia bacterium]
MTKFEAGTLVRCRERDWIVLPSESPDILMLRPLGGPEYEQIGIYLPVNQSLQIDEVESATFQLPDPAQSGDNTSARLLRDATRLNFRSGAGPFRSLGRLSVRPRPFQLVPLLMALRLDPVRLLIADDVGIGKTVEAGLIARELLDRGEARRLAVICPPHLCEQWQRELADKFGLEAAVVRSGTIAQLERGLPPGDITVFEHYPVLVVSIDFVKSERRKESFVRGCPDLVIVDEAHTAARSSSNRSNMQQRHELLRALAAGKDRHLLLLTATPHSGVEDAFLSLLELLNPYFGNLDPNRLSEQERKALARQFVQRRRADVQRWLGEDTPFPVREAKETTYQLSRSPEYSKLFNDILAFAHELVRDDTAIGQKTGWKQRVRYWTALALLRCVMSSPAAAETALRARLGKVTGQAGEEELLSVAETDQQLAQYVLDLGDQEVVQDFDPTPVVEEAEQVLGNSERARLQKFVQRAVNLRGDADPKLLIIAQEVIGLLRENYHPIIYCRYIATAEYLAAELKRRFTRQFPDLQVIAVTGASSEEEREQRVAELSTSPRRLLVATDCLSEGINLQEAFNAVIHYDLPWNPNRLEQREGRVDRYGQPSPIVRTLLLYGKDNPMDKIVWEVLIRKAVTIHKTLGITVPLPVDSESVVETVVRSLFQQTPVVQQLSFFDSDRQLDFGSIDETGMTVEDLHSSWDRAVEREKQSRTRYAQHAIKPEEVAPELEESDKVLGNAVTVANFVRNACERLGAPLVATRKADQVERTIWSLPLLNLPPTVRERLSPVFTSPKTTQKSRGQDVLITFETPVPEGVRLIHRLHPLTEALAEHLLSSALERNGNGNLPPASRSGAIRTRAVSTRTTLALLRLRLLIETAGRAVPLLAEELVVVAFEGSPDAGNVKWLPSETAINLLENALPDGNLTTGYIEERVAAAVGWLKNMGKDLEEIAYGKAEKLLESHRRVRQATHTGRVTVRPQLPPDVLGVYVYLPVVS